MRPATKSNKTFSLDKEILGEIKRTKGAGSESERVNNLLRSALDIERRASLQEEAAVFFGGVSDDRMEKSRAVYPTLGALSKASLATVGEAIKRSLELV